MAAAIPSPATPPACARNAGRRRRKRPEGAKAHRGSDWQVQSEQWKQAAVGAPAMDRPRDARAGVFNPKRIFCVLVLGAATAIAIAYGFALLVDPRSGTLRIAETALDDNVWTISRRDRFGTVLVEATSESVKRQWGTEQ